MTGNRVLGWIAGLAVIAAVAILVFSASLPAGMALAAIVLLGLVFMGRALATRQITGHTPADWPLLAMLLLLPVGLWASSDLAVTLARTYALVAAAALFWTAAALHNQPWLQYSGWALLAAGLALALAVLAGTPFSGLPALPLDVAALQARLPASFLAPDRFNLNLSGSLLALFLPPALALAGAGRGHAQRLAAAVVSALLAALLVLTQSRGAMLGVLVAVPVMTTLVDRRWLFLWLPLALAALGLALLTLRDNSQLQAALSAALLAGGSEVTATANGRLELWSRALYLMQDFPFTGVGLGMPERVINLLYPLFSTVSGNQWVHVHNTYLQIGSEMGIPGLITLTALLLAVGAALVRQARSRQAGVYRGLALGLLGSLLVFAVHGLVDAPLASPKLTVLFFGLLGLMAALAASSPVSPEPER